jgi:phosphoribosyl-dephospho-CoA transferase
LNWKRHTLIDVSDAGREAILAELAGSGHESAVLREKFGRVLLPDLAGARVPGIVRREDLAPRLGCVPLGFSEPLSNGQGRMRIAAFARLTDVAVVTSPYEVTLFPIPRRTFLTKAFEASCALAESLGIMLGVWGSLAIELYTGLPCTSEGSDLDLIVAAAPQERLSRFLTGIEDVEEIFRLRIDVELDLPSGYGIQLKEFFSQGRTVLGKGTMDVALLSREQILAELPYDSSYPTPDSFERLAVNAGEVI